MFTVTPFTHDKHDDVEALLDVCFGAGRRAKASYQYREGPPLDDLSLVAIEDTGRLVGTIAFWPVRVGRSPVPAALLGPLGVVPEVQGRGVGSALVEAGLERARQRGIAVVFLVGDEPYYRRFGFTRDGMDGIHMPNERQERVLTRALVPGVLVGLAGSLDPIGAAKAVRAAG